MFINKDWFTPCILMSWMCIQLDPPWPQRKAYDPFECKWSYPSFCKKVHPHHYIITWFVFPWSCNCFFFFCMVFLRCMEPVVIQQRDQQLYVTSEPHREWTSITRKTHLSLDHVMLIAWNLIHCAHSAFQDWWSMHQFRFFSFYHFKVVLANVMVGSSLLGSLNITAPW